MTNSGQGGQEKSSDVGAECNCVGCRIRRAQDGEWIEMPLGTDVDAVRGMAGRFCSIDPINYANYSKETTMSDIIDNTVLSLAKAAAGALNLSTREWVEITLWFAALQTLGMSDKLVDELAKLLEASGATPEVARAIAIRKVEEKHATQKAVADELLDEGAPDRLGPPVPVRDVRGDSEV